MLNNSDIYTEKLFKGKGKNINGWSVMKAILELKEGILLVRAQVKTDIHNKLIGHLFVVNSWMKVMIDNSKNKKQQYASYADVDLKTVDGSKKFFKQMNFVNIQQIDLLKVHVDKLPTFQFGF